MSIRELTRRVAPEPLLRLVRQARGSIARLGRGAGPSHEAHGGSTLDARLSYNRFGGYLVPSSSAHRPAAQVILDNEVYEAETIEFVRANCRDGDIVHAGAYFGDFLPALSSRCAPGALVWAFEPNEENFRCSEVTSLINNLQNVRLHHAGLGDRDAEAFVRIKDDEGHGLGGASTIVDASVHRSDLDQEVALMTVDRAVPRGHDVSIIQLDVEGHEQAALTGALATIERCRPILIVEVLPGSDLLDSSWFATNILSLGYEQTHVLDGNVVFTAPVRPVRRRRRAGRSGAGRTQA